MYVRRIRFITGKEIKPGDLAVPGELARFIAIRATPTSQLAPARAPA